MGWVRDFEPEVVFDAVIADDGVIWPAWTDAKGVLWIDSEDAVEVVVTGAIVDGTVFDAHLDRKGRLWVDW